MKPYEIQWKPYEIQWNPMKSSDTPMKSSDTIPQNHPKNIHLGAPGLEDVTQRRIRLQGFENLRHATAPCGMRLLSMGEAREKPWENGRKNLEDWKFHGRICES